MIRQCDQADVAAMFEIINGAAQAYKEIILAARAVHLLEELQYGIGAKDMRRSVHIAWTKFRKALNLQTCPSSSRRNFELLINLKAAKQIGLTIPESVLYRADKVIK